VGRFRLLFLVHPYLFQIGRVILPTYGFLVAAGIILSLLVCVRNARLLVLDTDRIWTMALLAIVTFLLVSKALLILVFWREYGPRALGMSVYGARELGVRSASIASACAASVAYILYRKLPLLRTGDAVAPSLALGSSIVSVACLEAGCDYGTPTHVAWAVVFRSRGAAPGTPLGVPLHPTQLYASLAAFLVFVVLLWLRNTPHHDGEVLGAGLFLGGLANTALAPLRGDPGPWIAGYIPVVQLLSAGMVLAAGCLWMRRPLVTSGG